MNKSTAFKNEISRVFKTMCNNVYHIQAPDKELFPYIVYESREMGHSDGKTTMQLEVNVVDYGKNTLVVDDLSDLIQDTFHKYYFINPFIEFVVYKGIRHPVLEEDKQILRRRMLFEVHLHELKGE